MKKMIKQALSVLLCMCMIVGMLPAAFSVSAAEQDSLIGKVVPFGNYEWYIIGTENEGVIAPEGCYTLFAKNNNFGSTCFRDTTERDEESCYYSMSELWRKMHNICSDYFYKDWKEDIVYYDYMDSIMGPDMGDYIWPLSRSEVESLDVSIRQFDETYWTRTGVQNDVGESFIEEDAYGNIVTSTVYPYFVYCVSPDGSASYTGGALESSTPVNQACAIRPAMYVKASAISAVSEIFVDQQAFNAAEVGGNLQPCTSADLPLYHDYEYSEDKTLITVNEGEQTQNGNTLYVNYMENANASPTDQYLICYMTDEGGDIKYIGKLADGTATKSRIPIPLDNVEDGTYTLGLLFIVDDEDRYLIGQHCAEMTVTMENGIGTVSDYQGEINPKPDIVKQLTNQTPDENGSVTFAFEATDANDNIVYTWQVQPKTADPQQGAWEEIYEVNGLLSSPYNSPTLTFPDITSWNFNDTGRYVIGGEYSPAMARFRCVATQEIYGSSAVSNPVEIVYSAEPVITMQPTNQEPDENNSVTFSVEASIPFGELTYTWYVQPKTAAENDGWMEISKISNPQGGALTKHQSSELTISDIASADWPSGDSLYYYNIQYLPTAARFRCVVTSKDFGTSVTSDTVEIMPWDPVFITQPADVIMAEDGSVTLCAEVQTKSGQEIIYNWQAQSSDDNPLDETSWYTIYKTAGDSGSETVYEGNSLAIENAMNTWQSNGYSLGSAGESENFPLWDAHFRCVVTEQGATEIKYYSRSARLLFPDVVFTVQPSVQLDPDTQSIKVAAEAEADLEEITYSWQVQSQTAGSDSPWYTLENMQSGAPQEGSSLLFGKPDGTWEENGYAIDGEFSVLDAMIRCVATGKNSGLSAVSDWVKIEYLPESVFTKQPTDQEPDENNSVTFSVEASIPFGELTYTWYVQPKTAAENDGWTEITKMIGIPVGLVQEYHSDTLTISDITSADWPYDNDSRYVGISYLPTEARFRCVVTNDTFNISESSDVVEILCREGEHSWGSWKKTDENEHTRVCSICRKEESEEHSRNEEYFHDGEKHWLKCSVCGEKIPEEAHNWENGKCTVCQYSCTHEGGEASYFKKAVCEICGSEYGDLAIDTTLPTGKITVAENTWTELQDPITFALSFQAPQQVEITASDDSYNHTGYTEEKAVTIAYYIHNGDTALTEQELQEKTFTNYEGSFSIASDAKYVIYAKITDHAGNVTYLSSNGIILDTSAPTAPSVSTNGYQPGEWLNTGKVTLTVSGSQALSGIAKYQYSVDNGTNWTDLAIDADETASLVVSEETDGTSYLFRAVSNSGVTSAATEPVVVKIDRTAPDGDICFNEVSVKKDINAISFGLLFPENVSVTITGTDNYDSTVKIEYYLSDQVLSETALDAVTDWTETNGSFSIAAADQKKFVCYVRLTDAAGNVAVFGSNGASFDLSAPVISGIENGAVYYATQKVTVADENLKSVTLDGAAMSESFTLAGDTDKTYAIIATDMVGNVTEYTVTMKTLSSLMEQLQDLTVDNVTSGDRNLIKSVEAAATANRDSVTAEEKAVLDEIEAKCNELLKKIAQTNSSSSSSDVNIPSDVNTQIESIVHEAEEDTTITVEAEESTTVSLTLNSMSETVEKNNDVHIDFQYGEITIPTDTMAQLTDVVSASDASNELKISITKPTESEDEVVTELMNKGAEVFSVSMEVEEQNIHTFNDSLTLTFTLTFTVSDLSKIPDPYVLHILNDGTKEYLVPDSISGNTITVKGINKLSIFAVIPGSEVPQEQRNPFKDVNEKEYYYDAVLWAAKNGITAGASDTSFEPDMVVSRAQMVTFLWRAYGSPKATGENIFTDVSEDDYYYDAVLWAAENGVTVGTSDTTFSPDAAVTRAQAVTFQWRAAGAPMVSGSSFDDVASDAYYINSVNWAAANDITAGTSATSFSPDVVVSRAQAVTFLYRELSVSENGRMYGIS